MKECEKFRLMADEYTDGACDGKTAAEFEAHIAVCADCRGYAESLAALKKTLSDSAYEMPSGLHERICGAVAEERRNEEKKTALKKRLSFTRAAAAACAAVFVLLCVSSAFLGVAGRRSNEKNYAEEADAQKIAADQVSEAFADIEASSYMTFVPEITSIGNSGVKRKQETDVLPPAEATMAEGADDPAEAEGVPTEAVWIPTVAAEGVDIPAEAYTNDTSYEYSFSGASLAADAEMNTEKSGAKKLAPTQAVRVLLILSGLLAVASFAAFLISLSAVRRYPQNDNSGNDGAGSGKD